MSFDEVLGTILGVLIVVLVISTLLIALFLPKSRTKRGRSRSTFTQGIDDVSVDGDGTADD